MKHDSVTVFATATVTQQQPKLDDTYLESVPSITDSDGCIVRQILSGVGQIFRRPAGYRRLVDTHVGDQYGVVLSHRDTAHARHSVYTSRTRPVLHLHLQHYNSKTLAKFKLTTC